MTSDDGPGLADEPAMTLRHVFDASADRYHRARPRYPNELLEALDELAERPDGRLRRGWGPCCTSPAGSEQLGLGARGSSIGSEQLGLGARGSSIGVASCVRTGWMT